MAAAPCSRIADCPPGAASAGDKADAGTRTGRFQHPADHEYGPGRRSQIAPGNAQRRAERVLCSPASRPAPCRCGVLASGRDGSQRACRAHREAASKGQRDQRQHNGSQHAERAPVSFGSHTVRAPLLRYRQAPTGLADGLAVKHHARVACVLCATDAVGRLPASDSPPSGQARLAGGHWFPRSPAHRAQTIRQVDL